MVPKAGNQTRLIFHLSYKFNADDLSINDWIPEKLCSVKYNDLDAAVLNALKLVNQGLKQTGHAPILFFSKTDLKSAFRAALVSPAQRFLLICKAKNPHNGKFYYFVDKCLPFGLGTSCALFMRISNSLRHICETRAGGNVRVINYLDDFLFTQVSEEATNRLVNIFLNICELIQFPVALEKTEWASLHVIFLGLMLNGDTHTISIPLDKRAKAKFMLEYFSTKNKATVKELQCLAGYLNFLNKAVVPGRTFTRRMYSKFAGALEGGPVIVKGKQLKPHHHVGLDSEFKCDCKVWLSFLADVFISGASIC